MSARAWSPAARCRLRSHSTPTAASVAATSAAPTGETPNRYPAATPAKAACPIPSPIRLICRWTRKNPTAGASTPTTAPVAKAIRMKSASRMNMGRVVPVGGELGGGAVEDDAAADEDDALDESPHGAELVGDVEDRDTESLVQLAEERAESLLRVDVDTGGGLVENEELRLAGEGLRDEGALLLATGQPLDRRCRPVLETDARDRVCDRLPVNGAERLQKASAGDAAGGHHLAHGGRRIDREPGALREIPAVLQVAHAIGGLAEEGRLAFHRLLETECDAQEGRLAASVWAGDGDELAAPDLEVDAAQDLGPAGIRERDVLQLNG